MSKTAIRNVAAAAGDMQHKLAGVIWYWLQANRTAEAARRESVLDRASYDSFPASDPIAPAALCDPENEAQEVECIIDADRLTLRCVPQGATRSDDTAREPELEFDGERPDGGRLHVRVHICAVPSAQNAVDQSEATMPERPVHAGPLAGERRRGAPHPGQDGAPQADGDDFKRRRGDDRREGADASARA